MNSVLILSAENLKTDPRIRRQINALKNNYELTVFGTHSPEIEGINFLKINREYPLRGKKLIHQLRLFFRMYKNYYWNDSYKKNIISLLENKKYDLVIANDIDMLPIAVVLKEKGIAKKIFFDAHEYAPLEFEDVLKWKLFHKPYKTYLCKKYIPYIDLGTTVCEGIAEEYYKVFNKKFHVITNACDYVEAIPKNIEDKVKMVFHGAATPSRKLENIIETTKILGDNFKLDMYLVGDKDYIGKLENIIISNQILNINICKPVEFSQINNMLKNYDIGIYILEPNSFNNKMALPNKLFEFIQARLAVAIGPSPEMARYVNMYDCGVVANSFLPIDMANILKKLTKDELYRLKLNTQRFAEEQSAESNAKKMINLIEACIKG